MSPGAQQALTGMASVLLHGIIKVTHLHKPRLNRFCFTVIHYQGDRGRSGNPTDFSSHDTPPPRQLRKTLQRTSWGILEPFPRLPVVPSDLHTGQPGVTDGTQTGLWKLVSEMKQNSPRDFLLSGRGEEEHFQQAGVDEIEI